MSEDTDNHDDPDGHDDPDEPDDSDEKEVKIFSIGNYWLTITTAWCILKLVSGSCAYPKKSYRETAQRDQFKKAWSRGDHWTRIMFIR